MHGGGALARAYAAIGGLTPLPYDCGRLCGAACCKDIRPGCADDGERCADGGERCADDYGHCADDYGHCADDGERCANGGERCADDGERCADGESLCGDPEEEYGMLLFPGEVERFHGAAGFRTLRIDYMDSKVWMLLCDCGDGGDGCDRRRRPLACRYFPLAPNVDEDGHVSARVDPRARRICPLVGYGSQGPRFARRDGSLGSRFARRDESLSPRFVRHEGSIDPNFTRAVARAFRELAHDSGSFELMRLISDELAELRRFI